MRKEVVGTNLLCEKRLHNLIGHLQQGDNKEISRRRNWSPNRTNQEQERNQTQTQTKTRER